MKLFKNKKIKIILLTLLSSVALIIPTITLVSCSNGSKEQIKDKDVIDTKMELEEKFMEDLEAWNRQNGHKIPVINSVPGNPEYVNATLSNFKITYDYNVGSKAVFKSWDYYEFNQEEYYTWEDYGESEWGYLYKVTTKKSIPLNFFYISTEGKEFTFDYTINIDKNWTYYCRFLSSEK